MKMDRNMIAYCGAYCGVCEWKDKIGCKGCKANAGTMFWGECDKACCCIEKGLCPTAASARICPARSCRSCLMTRNTATGA